MKPCLLALLVLTVPCYAQTTLPAGKSPPALQFTHFPTPAHAVIFRNFGLVDTARLAKILDTTPDQIRATAAAIGLEPEPAKLPPLSRVYLTIIRRNWHLLPYDQILGLLDWTPDRLAETLREDDFFF